MPSIKRRDECALSITVRQHSSHITHIRHFLVKFGMTQQPAPLARLESVVVRSEADTHRHANLAVDFEGGVKLPHVHAGRFRQVHLAIETVAAA